MKQDIYLIDAFTSAAFRGNPAGVCVMEAFLPDALMQSIALEMNQAETAFLVPEGKLEYALRWFTPAAEVDLCGHATLAATHALRELGLLQAGGTVRYRTRSGELRATVMDNAIELDFPALPGTRADIPDVLKACIPVPFTVCENNGPNYLIEVANYNALMHCIPDPRLKALGGVGVIVTTDQGIPAGFDFASRYFAPNVNVDEDPVTGSAHCMLVPYWSNKLGKMHFRALQASPRTGTLEVTLTKERVLLKGSAVTTLKGQLFLPAAGTAKEAA